MKAKALVVLVVAIIWGLGSWWWYTCKIKGFCGTPAHTEPTEASQPSTVTPTTEITTAKPESEAAAKAQVADQPTPTDTQLTALTINTPKASELQTSSKPESTTPEPTPTAKLAAQTATQVDPKPEPTTPEPTAEPAASTTSQATASESSETSKEIATTIDPPQPTEPISVNTDDSDKDGIPNELEKKLGLDPYMADSDEDGVSDQDELGAKPAEAPLDTDDDGTINALDPDDDGDGDPTANESVDPNRDGSVADARDSDQDAIPDYLDKDSNWASLDDDNDGFSNGEEKEIGTNPSLTDSDGDGVPDKIELVDKKDTDEDGILDALDTDDDNDGIMTAMENPDPNNDGKLEDAVDHNKNGVADYLDAKASGETVAPSQASAEPTTKDPDMATGQSAPPASTASLSSEPKPESEAESTAQPATSQPTAAPTQEPPATTDKQPQPVTTAKSDDSNKITVDLDKPTADKKNVSSARLYFPFRSTKPELADSTAAYFDDLISFLNANPSAKVKVIGHTDNVGDAEINEKLGLQRAERIRTQLIRRGAPADRVEASSKGESAPWVSNKTEEGRNKNRRVEVKPIK